MSRGWSRRGVAAAVAAVAVLAASCGGDGGEAGSTTGTTDGGDTTLTAPAWAAPLLRKAGPESAAVMASTDFAVGSNRVSFLLVRANGGTIDAPLADVYYRPQAAGPTRKALARLTPFGAAGTTGQDTGDVKAVYVARLELQRAGKQWVVIQPRGVAFQGFQILDVNERPAAVAIGDRAPASANPTTASRPAKRITTARPPDTALLRYSVAESLRDHVPFVVAFATPAYCQSRTCGPTVDVVDAVRKRFESRGIRFIHVEIYEDNLPGNGVNQWVRQWKLPTEPWVFVVDRTGVVRDRFEGAASVRELSASVRTHLLGG